MSVYSEAVALSASRRISVFAEAPYQGTRALVQLCQQAPRERDMKKLAQEGQEPVACFVWPLGGTHFGAACFSAKGRIRCCGHGLLAAAYALHTLWLNSSQPVQLYLPGERKPLSVRVHEGGCWLALPRIACNPCDVPPWSAGALTATPLAAATAGGEQGYLVLEIASTTVMDQVQVDLEVLCAHTQRSVILTQESRCKSYDFLSRYFAPQYGVPEDKVTGSGNRVLADYWSRKWSQQRWPQKNGASHFRALQCSASGGVVELNVLPHSIEIGGRLKCL
jgi:predicted PhzF superfamily epimerase YddE/YHI9